MVKPQSYRDVVKILTANGWVLLRQGKGSHELWGLPDGSVYEAVYRGEVSAGVIRKLIVKLPKTPANWR